MQSRCSVWETQAGKDPSPLWIVRTEDRRKIGCGGWPRTIEYTKDFSMGLKYLRCRLVAIKSTNPYFSGRSIYFLT